MLKRKRVASDRLHKQQVEILQEIQMEESKEMKVPKEKKEEVGESPVKKLKVQVEAVDSTVST